MRIVLGLDQGGSKTHAILGREDGTVLGLGAGPGVCHAIAGMGAAMAAVRGAAEQALAGTDTQLSDVARVYAGMTGADWPEEGPLLRDALAAELGLPRERITVVNDCMIALRAATDCPRAAILCAGSGLNCGVRRGEREIVFGYYVSDEDQGGGALARRAVQAVIDGACGLRPVTGMSAAVLKALNCPDAETLLRRRVAGALDGESVLRLPEVLERCALAEDAAAVELLETFGRDIARYPVAGLRRLGLAQEDAELVLSGSVFKCRARVLQDTVIARVRQAVPRIRVTESEYEPIAGAMLGALDELGISAEGPVMERLRRGAETFGLFRKP